MLTYSEAKHRIAFIRVMLDDEPDFYFDRAISHFQRLMRYLHELNSSIERFCNDLEACVDCGRLIPAAFALYAEDGPYEGDHLCPSCCSARHPYEFSWRDRRVYRWYEPEPEWESGSELADYDTSPFDVHGRKFLRMPNEAAKFGTRYFGFEIEFTAPERDEVALDDALHNRAIVKKDGSLCDSTGAELVTLPMTGARARLEMQVLCDMLQKHGARAWNDPRCGLHIHVSRDSADWITWARVDEFLEALENQEFVDHLIACRRANMYCKRGGHAAEIAYSKKALRAIKKYKAQRDRYVALNFPDDKKTGEFRLFRGNVSYGGVMRCMEFCDAILNFAAASSLTAPMHHELFLAWLRQQPRKIYGNLQAYIFKRRGTDEPSVAA